MKLAGKAHHGNKAPCEASRVIHQRRMVMARAVDNSCCHGRVAGLVSQVASWKASACLAIFAATSSRSWRLRAMTAKFDDDWPVRYDGYTADEHL